MISQDAWAAGCQQSDNKNYRKRPKRCGLGVGQKALICGEFISQTETCRNRGPALLIPRSLVRSQPGPYEKARKARPCVS